MNKMEEVISEADKVNELDERLIAFIERIEHLEEEKKELAGDIREVYAEAKAKGYFIPAIKKIIKLRQLDKSDRDEQEFIYEKYKSLTGL